MVISTIQNRNDAAGLFKLFALVFLAAAIVLTLTAFIMKKLRRRRRKHHRPHATEERAVMKPYTETEGYGEAFSKDSAEEETQAEAEAEPHSDEHVYQVYTIVPKRPNGKKKNSKKDR